MFTRVLNFRGAKNIDGGVGLVRDSATPVLREQKGYRGTTASADRDGGVFGILSLWDTEANRDGSFDALAGLRQQALDVMGGELTVDSFELLVEEIVSPHSRLSAHGHADQHGSFEGRREFGRLQE